MGRAADAKSCFQIHARPSKTSQETLPHRKERRRAFCGRVGFDAGGDRLPGGDLAKHRPDRVARILDGTGRVNVGQGAVMTVQGLGASISPAIGGWIAQDLGYPPTFLILGAFAIGSIGLWLAFAPILKPACAGKPRSVGHSNILAASPA